MSGEISISGKVQDYDQKPIYLIQVSAWVVDDYTNLREVDRAYTNEGGMYKLSVLPGKPISIRFDTHWSLVNVNEWHPAVIQILTQSKVSTQPFSYARWYDQR